jgi:hypothetical protein
MLSAGLIVILAGETEPGPAGMQPCRGVAPWAHRGERGNRLSRLSPKSHQVGRPLCVELSPPEGRDGLCPDRL